MSSSLLDGYEKVHVKYCNIWLVREPLDWVDKSTMAAWHIAENQVHVINQKLIKKRQWKWYFILQMKNIVSFDHISGTLTIEKKMGACVTSKGNESCFV